MSEAKIRMKLLVDKSKNKVLFAEAGKECVDFLFHILLLPLGSVVGFLTKEAMANGIGGLYGSLEGLSTDYLLDSVDKDTLLNPKLATGSSSNVPLLTTPDPDPVTKETFYACSNDRHRYMSDVGGQKCPGPRPGRNQDPVFSIGPACSGLMNQVYTYVTPTEPAQPKWPRVGYVKGVVTYMIMDDLCVQPMSKVSSIALFNSFEVSDVASLEEREVTLDINLGLALLKTALISSTVLTDVFVLKSLDIASGNGDA